MSVESSVPADTLEKRLQSIESALGRMEKTMDKTIVPECTRMGAHISFIERVYATLRRPLGRFVDWKQESDDYAQQPAPMAAPQIEDVD